LTINFFAGGDPHITYSEYVDYEEASSSSHIISFSPHEETSRRRLSEATATQHHFDLMSLGHEHAIAHGKCLQGSYYFTTDGFHIGAQQAKPLSWVNYVRFEYEGQQYLVMTSGQKCRWLKKYNLKYNKKHCETINDFKKRFDLRILKLNTGTKSISEVTDEELVKSMSDVTDAFIKAGICSRRYKIVRHMGKSERAEIVIKLPNENCEEEELILSSAVKNRFSSIQHEINVNFKAKCPDKCQNYLLPELREVHKDLQNQRDNGQELQGQFSVRFLSVIEEEGRRRLSKNDDKIVIANMHLEESARALQASKINTPIKDISFRYDNYEEHGRRLFANKNWEPLSTDDQEENNEMIEKHIMDTCNNNFMSDKRCLLDIDSVTLQNAIGDLLLNFEAAGNTLSLSERRNLIQTNDPEICYLCDLELI